VNNNRVKEFGEVFTPPELVNEILDHLPCKVWEDQNKTWLDPTCGDGAFLIEVKNRLLKYHKLSHILNTMLYGVDIQENNVYNCIVKLYNIKETNRVHIINTKNAINTIAKDNNYILGGGINSLFLVDGKLVTNFICADGLIYQYNFGKSMDIRKEDEGKTTLQDRCF